MDINLWSLFEIRRAMGEGTLQPRELIEQCEEAHDPGLHAYRLHGPELARAQGDAAAAALACGADPGALCGIPVSVKDIFGLAGCDTYAGSAKKLPPEWAQEGPLVRRLRGQLAVTVGKTHSVEFAFGGLGTNPHWPTPVNPNRRSEQRVPGGSSSGAGVSIREGSALLALGTDTSGSVRVPASMTGVAGFKPSRGVWSTSGIVPLSTSLDTPGVLARSAADLAFAFAGLTGGEMPAPPALAAVELALPRQLVWEGCDAGVVEAVEAALTRVRRAGARTADIDMPEINTAAEIHRAGSLAAAELDHFLETQLPEWRDGLDPNVAVRVQANRELSAREYIDRRQRLTVLAEAADARLAPERLLALPTVAITPPTQAEVVDPAVYAARNSLALRNTCTANLADLCAVTIACGVDRAGMPVGLQLMGRRGHEGRLLGVARAIEQALSD